MKFQQQLGPALLSERVRCQILPRAPPGALSEIPRALEEDLLPIFDILFLSDLLSVPGLHVSLDTSSLSSALSPIFGSFTSLLLFNSVPFE